MSRQAKLEVLQQEYRLGSYLWIHNKKGRKRGLTDVWDPRRVDDPYMLYLAVVGNGFSMPIELNSDILDKVNEIAKEKEGVYSSSVLKGFKVVHDKVNKYYVVQMGEERIRCVKYLHQLQNVFLDIAGVDMTIPIREVLYPIVWFSPDNLIF